MDGAANICAGPFGALYDLYIERPQLMRLVGRAFWGIDASVLYRSMEPIGRVADGATIIDVPCGGGVALRALRSEQDVRYIAGDISARMLARGERRARQRGLGQVEFHTADMTALPFPDGEADLFLSYSGLHMVNDPERALREIARVLRPGGRLIGTTFLAEGARRARIAFELGRRQGHAVPPSRENVLRWMRAAGIEQATIGPERGFARISGVRAAS